jgi:hypothetical protein
MTSNYVNFFSDFLIGNLGGRLIVGLIVYFTNLNILINSLIK